MAATIQNRLSELRQARGIAAADLASRVGVKRQTIYAIEGGTFVPNTEVTLRLARELGVTVEELFKLPDEPDLDIVHGEVLGAVGREIAQTVQVARVGGKLIGVPVTASPYFLAEGDGLVSMTRQRGSDMALIKPNDRYEKRLVLAGCDPAIGLLAVAAGCNSVAAVTSWAAPNDLSERYAGTLAGVLNMCTNLGGALSPVLTPYLAGRFGWVAALDFAAGFMVCVGLLWLAVDLRRRID